jgi:hypothetical protein
MKRRIRCLRQLVPTKFATAHRVPQVAITHSTGPVQATSESRPIFTTWWMWLGHSFRVKHTAI